MNMELAKCQIDILLEIRNKPISYSNDALSGRLEEESDFEFIYTNNLIDYNPIEGTNQYLVEVTPLGKIEIEKYLKSLDNEAREKKRWFVDNIVAWIGVAIGIAALLVAILKD